MKVLVCGSRKFWDRSTVADRLGRLAPNALVIAGGASGADSVAQSVARDLGLHVARVDALWHQYGKKAGVLRNLAMLKLEPDLVIAFRNQGSSPGTDHMIGAARARGLPVEVWIDGLGWQEDSGEVS